MIETKASNYYCIPFILTVIIFVFASCNNLETNTKGNVKIILGQKSQEFSQAYMNKNFDKIVEAYTEDGLVIANRKGFIQGHEKLSEY